MEIPHMEVVLNLMLSLRMHSRLYLLMKTPPCLQAGEEVGDIYRGSNKPWRGRGRGYKSAPSSSWRDGGSSSRDQGPFSSSRDGDSSSTNSLSSSNRKNALDSDGNHTQCYICKSIFHWTSSCPHKYADQNKLVSELSAEAATKTSESATLLTEHLVMFESNCQNTSKLSELLSQTWNTAVLDCGAKKTVTG